MPNLYADPTETINDVLPNVKTNNASHVATITRIIEAASRLVDSFTNRPVGYFTGIGTDVSTPQKINIAIDIDDLTTDATARLEITAAAIPGSPIAVNVNAEFGVSTNATIATAFAAAIEGNELLAAYLNVTDNGGDLDLELSVAAPIDETFAATVAAVETGTGLTPTGSTVAVAGEYAVPASVRRYRGRGRNFLQIGRHVPGSVTIDGTSETLYYEHPETGWLYAVDNANVAGVGDGSGDGYIPDRSNQCFFADGALYLITGRWGFAATPADIVYATKLIVGHVWDRGQGVIGEVSPSGFVIERDMPLTAKTLLDRWIKREFEVN